VEQGINLLRVNNGILSSNEIMLIIEESDTCSPTIIPDKVWVKTIFTHFNEIDVNFFNSVYNFCTTLTISAGTVLYIVSDNHLGASVAYEFTRMYFNLNISPIQLPNDMIIKLYTSISTYMFLEIFINTYNTQKVIPF